MSEIEEWVAANSWIVTDAASLQKELDYFLRQEAFVFDVETTGENRGAPTQNRVSWLSMATTGRTIVIPMGHPNGNKIDHYDLDPRVGKDGKVRNYKVPVWEAPPQQLRPSEVFNILEPLFFSTTIEKSAHGAVFDLITLMKYYDGRKIPQPTTCTIVQQHVLDENMMTYGLKDMVKKYYGADYDHEHVGRCVEKHSFARVAKYAFLDAKYGWLLYKRNGAKIEPEQVSDIYAVEKDVLDVLVDMGYEGAPLDIPATQELKEILADKCDELESAIYKAAGRVFNINSNPDKISVFFGSKEDGGQGLKVIKKTPSGQPSTDKEVLEAYEDNPVVSALQEYTEAKKLLSTYVLRYLGETDDEKVVFDGKVYANFVQYGTVTGRFSCRTPNLQNVKRPDPTNPNDFGTMLRRLFIAPPKHKLIVADYGQFELVILAHYLGAGKLFEGFHKGVDPHTMTAALIFGVKPEEVTKAQRQVAKAINFAVIYGAGTKKVAAMAGTTVKEAGIFLKKHQMQFPEIYRFKDAVIRTCRQRTPVPYITTLLGRKRRLPTINSRDESWRMYAERQAVNSLIQGSQADLIKLAMVNLNKTLPPDMKLLLTIHDELVVKVPEDKVKTGLAIVTEAMTGPHITKHLSVPVKIDINAGNNWAECK